MMFGQVWKPRTAFVEAPRWGVCHDVTHESVITGNKVDALPGRPYDQSNESIQECGLVRAADDGCQHMLPCYDKRY
jgi:hypothetical protein